MKDRGSNLRQPVSCRPPGGPEEDPTRGFKFDATLAAALTPPGGSAAEPASC
jgi:hypothetical protein